MRRSLAGLAAVLFLYALFGFAVLPGIVKSQLDRLAAEKLHRPLSIGAIDINPFALTFTMRNLSLKERNGDAVFASFDDLTVNLSTESLFRLAPVVQQVRLTKPYVRLVRRDAHHYNIDDILDMLASEPPSDEPARFSVYNIQVEGGQIQFEDKPAGATHQVTELALGVPFISSLPSQVQIFVEPLLSAKVNGTPLSIHGKARPFAEPMEAVVDFALSDHDLTRYLGYLPFKPSIRMPSARIDLKMTASFRQPKDKKPELVLDGNAALKALKVDTVDGKPVLRVPEFAVELRNASVFGDRFEISRVRLTGVEADIGRERDGSLNVQRLLSAPQAAPAPKRSKESAGPQIVLDTLELRGIGLRYADEHASQPMQAGVEKLDLTVRKLAIDPRKKTVSVDEVLSDNAGLLVRENKPGSGQAQAAPAPAGSGESEAPYAVSVNKLRIRNWSARLEDNRQETPATTLIAPLSLSVDGFSTASASTARVALQTSVNKTGQLAVDGTVGLSPFQTELKINAKGVDISPLQPYIADKVNLRLTRGSLTTDGKLQIALAEGGALKGGFKGDVTLGNLGTVDKLSGDDFLRWKSLFAGGIDMRLEPFALTVDQLALSDFFARIIIDPAGRINLQNILRGDEDHQSLTAEHATQPVARAASKAEPASKTPPLAIRKVTLQGGRVRFTDNFIKPNYSATLNEFGGVVTDLSSDPASRANVAMQGLVSGAPLTVNGSINPLRGNLFLDVKANVRGMELSPLSAYSGKYVGYGIEKGKLSFEVAYRVDDRKLSAENRLILDQLTFGEPIESPTATKLPVHFAVALLRDGNGVIDLNLPISGSLDDPQFSVGGILFKAFFNLIAKAVTQPFAIIGALFGGGAELSSISLDAGRALIPPSGEEKLKSLAKALTDRPSLKLDITGRFDTETDREALKRVAIERKVRAVKMRDLRARGANPEPGTVTVQPEEYRELLTRAYRDEPFPKPRNVVGLPKELPVEEMEKLMIANTEIDEDDLVALGNQRAQTVKNWLQKNGQVPSERIFILAPKAATPETKGKENLAAHRVDFSLR